jgi:L-fuconolactonase
VTPEQREAEAEYIIALCEKGDGPTVAAVIGGSPGGDGFRDYITHFKGSRYVKGVRESFRAGCFKDKAFLNGLRLLGELGMCFDLQLGPELLPEASAVVAACPQTRFVLDHCGGADPRDFDPKAPWERVRRAMQWQAGIQAIGQRPNVICKISGLLESAAPDRVSANNVAPVVKYCIDQFGPERAVFASNWPVVNRGGSFGGWVNMLRQVTSARTREQQQKLIHDNAIAFYGLE